MNYMRTKKNAGYFVKMAEKEKSRLFFISRSSIARRAAEDHLSSLFPQEIKRTPDSLVPRIFAAFVFDIDETVVA